MHRGFITLWHDVAATIPAGWLFCDGQFGTPDLRDSFVRCPDREDEFGTTGGSTFHKHDVTIDSHTHSFPTGVDLQGGGFFTDEMIPRILDEVTDNRPNLPKYKSLVYMMKT